MGILLGLAGIWQEYGRNMIGDVWEHIENPIDSDRDLAGIWQDLDGN